MIISNCQTFYQPTSSSVLSRPRSSGVQVIKREHILSTLNTLFDTLPRAQQTTIVLIGMGGRGKSQVAFNFTG